MKIDTDYKSLEETSPAVVGYYSEEKRQRLTGYTEEEEPQPIYEPYTVIVLNKPEVILYSEVAQRKGERKSEAVVMAELDRAIGFEEFYFNHDLYLAWVADYAKWEEEQPTETITNEDGTEEAVIVPAPEQPAIDLSNRREFYRINEVAVDESAYHVLPSFTVTYDDDQRMALKSHSVKKKTKKEIAAEKAAQRRTEAKAYLLATDYIAARMAEGGEPMPNDVKEKRGKAREVLNGSYIEPHIESFYP